MPENLFPGVFIEEIAFRAKPIEGVPTSTAGFIGVTERGPIAPLLVTSWLEYARAYGTYIDDLAGHTADIYLPYAVRGFFENGGRRLYVARVTGAAAETAKAYLPNGGCIAAIGPGAWCNQLRFQITPATQPHLFCLQVLYRRRGFADGVIFPWAQTRALTPEETLLLAEPEILERYENLSADPSANNFAPRVVNEASRLVRLELPANKVPKMQDGVALESLTGGTDSVPDADAYVGGLTALAAIEEIALLAVPGHAVGSGNDIATRCSPNATKNAIASQS